MAQQLLLLEDVHGLGHKGEIVNVKSPGYVRNFLLPKLRREHSEFKTALAVIATPHSIRKQEQLRAARAERAVVDLKEAQELAKHIESIKIDTTVSVDPMGNMYGSVSASDIAQIFAERGLTVDKRFVQLNKPIKEIGKHKISLKLKEGVTAVCDLTIRADGAPIIDESMAAVVKPIEETEAPSDSE